MAHGLGIMYTVKCNKIRDRGSSVW